MHILVPIVATILAAYDAASNPTANDLSSEIFTARQMFNGPFMKALDHRANQTNVIVSNYAIHSALSSLMAGASGNTYQELWDALGYKFTKLDQQSLLDLNRLTISNLSQLHDSGLLFSNLLAVEQKLPIKQGFKDALTNDFGAAVMSEDFINNAVKATNDINNWVNTSTNGKIQTLFDEPLSVDTRAIIANAIYFNSTWLTHFNERSSFKGMFNLANKTQKEVTYMKIPANRLKHARHLRSFGFSAVQIPFDDAGRLWFGIQLPDYNGPNMDCCTPATDAIHNTHEADINLTIPKFSIEQTHKAIKDILQGMGIKSLFDPNSADLSKINGERDLFVSKIAQKATVTIDEKGVEAAAATGVVIESRSLPLPVEDAIDFVVDKPFIFSISDRASNVDLFTGIIYDP